ncbi:ATP synthase F1 subunit epsilon [Candidatus Avelusimicrobium gallicola]|uniref:ATP synthase epsilon chain n=1 Tax=Candidatus Avelusimicrobium gallicola TaxID=2562704 RepID=A0A1Y4DEW6_9BACT|nr:ATP synthase F1 subunit epsilon [Elusimicrobium sp. An273]OUO57664.1 ATP synthase F1 subunit epsilon [Elusimicrobium sp. An273]
MSKKLTLNLITPEKQLISNREADMVVLPALLGEMGILPGHIKTIVQLGMGSLRYKNDGKEEEFAVLGGFAEVLHNVVNVFAEGADLADEIDEEVEKQKIKAVKESLSRKDADIDFELAEIEIKQAIARMKVKKRHM